MFASSGETDAPCGEPCGVSDHVPSSMTPAVLAAALFAHDLAAFRVHAAAGLGGDGTCSLAAAASLAGHVDGGPGGPCPGCASGRGRLGLWFLVCCCGPGAGDP